MEPQTIQWDEVLADVVSNFEYVLVLDNSGGSVYRELEYIADYEIVNGSWHSLGDDITYTLSNCEPRRVNKYASVTVYATNDINEMPGDYDDPRDYPDDIMPDDDVWEDDPDYVHMSDDDDSDNPNPVIEVPYFNDKTIYYLKARDKFNTCDVNWTDCEIKALDHVIKHATNADIVDFIVACLAAKSQAVENDA